MRSIFKWSCSKVFMVLSAALLMILIWNNYLPTTSDAYLPDDSRFRVLSLRLSEAAKSKKQTIECNGETLQYNHNEPAVLSFGENGWDVDTSVCAGIDAQKGKEHFQKVIHKSFLGDMPLYIHNPKTDGVSGEIIKGNFEPYIFRTLHALLKLDPEVSMLDIGAHVGINALQAAKYGRNVIAIEATRECAQHMCASAIDGNVQSKLTIVRNAISNVHAQVKFLRSPKGDFGGLFMDDNDKSDLRKTKLKYDGSNSYNFNNYTVINSVMLDDLLQLPNICAFRKVLIKMDVEGSEHLAMDGATKFFAQVDVQGVLMEYRWHTERNTKYILMNFFERFKFDPFDFSTGYLRKLDPRSMTNHDVLWLPQSNSSLQNGVKIF